MGRKLPPVCLAAAVCLAFLAGCQTTRKKPPHPDDPLLLSKKPVDGAQEPVRPILLTRAEPVVPTMPTSLLAAQPEREPAARPFADLTVPTSRPAAPVVRATPALRRRVSETYGHADDFTWLQGVLTHSADGTLQLRYRAPSAQTAPEGVVMLEDDPRLSSFRSGDVVLVEGEGLGPPAPRSYRVRSIWLVKRGE